MTHMHCCDEHSEIHQSPIELAHDIKDILYSKSDLKISKTKIISKYDADKKQWNVINDIYMYNNDTRYKLIEYHLHIPGEHIIDNKKYLMEIHFVFRSKIEKECNDEIGSIFVLGYLIQQSKNRTSNMCRDIISDRPFKLSKFNKYFTYPGSLTTPPLNINVNWIISERILHITLESFKLIVNKCKSSRPIQKRNGRDIVFVSINN